jgi:glycine/D-amino acid oxidase-like deaminating enzyme
VTACWPASIEPLREGDELVGLRVDGREIRAQRIVLSAGGGTEDLLHALGLNQPAMQRRPLHMVMAKGPNLKPLYAHCLGGGPSRASPSPPTRPPMASGSGTWAATSPKPMAWPASLPRRSPPRRRKSPACCPGSTRA